MNHNSVSFSKNQRKQKKLTAFKLSLLASLIASSCTYAATDQQEDKKDKKEQEVMEEVVVVGNRLSNDAAGALMDKKARIGVNAIMSAQTILERPGGNITDILSTLPSVTAYSDMGKGQAATGEAEFLSVRGIDSSYNAYLMNGVRMPQADSSTRALSLKMIAPYGLSSARISKTPTAKEPGDAVGAVVELSTPTGFSLGDNYVKLTGGANYSQLANDRNFDDLGSIAQFEVANIFGDSDQYGLYATVYHETRNSVAETLEVGGYSRADESELDVEDARDLEHGLIANDLRLDFYNTEIERFGGNISFDQKLDNGNIYVRANYGRYEAVGSEAQRKLYVSSSDYDENGKWRPLTSGSNGYFQTRDQEATLANVLFGGDYSLQSNLSLDYSVSYGVSEQKTPNFVEGSLYSQKVDGAVSFDLDDPENAGISFSDDATREFLLSPSSPRFRKVQGRDAGSENTMYGVKFDFTYTPASFLDDVQAGVDYNVSDRDSYDRGLTGNNGDNYTIPTPDGEPGGSSNPQGPYADELAGQDINFRDGLFNNFRVYDRGYFEDFLFPVAYTDLFTESGQPNPGEYTENDYNRNTVSGKETITALYFQGQRSFGDLSVTAGLRYEDTDFEASHWLLDESNSRFVKDSSSYGQWLPNLNISYRPSEDIVYRFAARRSFSRPAFSLIAGPETYSYDQDTDELIRVNRSNPNLKPVTVNNYDASIEWYPAENAILEAAVYYKQFSNYIYTASTTGGQPPAGYSDLKDGQVSYIMPENGNDADLQGLELHGRYQFPTTVEYLAGFGADFTATFQDSSAQSAEESRTEDTDLPRSPNEAYNLQLFYQGNSISTALTWQYTGRQLLSLTEDKLDKYLQSNSQLDFNVTYHFDNWSITAQVQNVLNDETFHKTLGKGTRYLGTQDGGGNGSFVETGRTMKVFASYQF